MSRLATLLRRWIDLVGAPSETKHSGSLEADDVYGEFSRMIAELPDGIARNNSASHAVAGQILNMLTPSCMTPNDLFRMSTLWGWPMDDPTHEVDMISMDICENFNRLNKRILTVDDAYRLGVDENPPQGPGYIEMGCSFDSNEAKELPIPKDPTD